STRPATGLALFPHRAETRPAPRAFVAALAIVIVVSTTGIASVRSGLAAKAWRHVFPPKVGTVHVFGTGVPAVQPGPEPTQGPINTAFPGLTTFRGNASRDYYGEGPSRATRRSIGSIRRRARCAFSRSTRGSRTEARCRRGAAP